MMTPPVLFYRHKKYTRIVVHHFPKVGEMVHE
jgi:hypothetical protein